MPSRWEAARPGRSGAPGSSGSRTLKSSFRPNQRSASLGDTRVMSSGSTPRASFWCCSTDASASRTRDAAASRSHPPSRSPRPPRGGAASPAAIAPPAEPGGANRRRLRPSPARNPSCDRAPRRAPRPAGGARRRSPGRPAPARPGARTRRSPGDAPRAAGASRRLARRRGTRRAGSLHATGALRRGGVVMGLERGAEMVAAAGQTGHDRPDRTAQHRGDLPIRQPLDVPQLDGLPERGGSRRMASRTSAMASRRTRISSGSKSRDGAPGPFVLRPSPSESATSPGRAARPRQRSMWAFLMILRSQALGLRAGSSAARCRNPRRRVSWRRSSASCRSRLSNRP